MCADPAESVVYHVRKWRNRSRDRSLYLWCFFEISDTCKRREVDTRNIMRKLKILFGLPQVVLLVSSSQYLRAPVSECSRILIN